MTQFSLYVGVFILLFSSLNYSVQKADALALDFGDIKDILSLGREITVGALESLEWIQKGSLDSKEQLSFPFIKSMERRLTDQISTINDKIKLAELRIEQRGNEVVDMILRELPPRQQLDRNLNDLSKYLGRIDDFYSKFIEYSKSPNKFEKFTKIDFAESCVSSEYGGLPDILMSTHRIIVPSSTSFEKSLLVQLARNVKEASVQICDEQQSPQQLLYNLYNTIALTEIKGYAMMQFSYTLLRLYKNGTFDEERNRTTRDYTTRTSETLRAVKTAMAFAPNDLWRCDPNVHEEGKTFEELKQLFQGYIVNEVDLNPTQTCRENCAYYTYAKVYGCYDNKQCAQQRKCNGKVVHCQYVDSDMWVCPSERNSNRRYEYIEYENGRQLGTKNTCKKSTTKVDSWWRWLFWHCSYCMCFCDDYNANSDRYFNLRDITSDVINNKVVTGIKLVKSNQIIHIQIQEGKLLPRGEIDASSVSWRSVDNFTIRDSNVMKGRDFHTLSWENRAIDLDDLVAPPQQLLTGARFRVVGAHLNFEIRVTPFNFTSGLLIKPLEMSTWVSNDNTDFHDSNQSGRRTEFVIDKPDIPTRGKAPNFPDSKTNQFLNFAPTDLGKDVAQTTIPFIDIQPVVTNPPFPLSGAGIYHKGRSGFGGYIAPKIMTYDFTSHLNADVPPPPPVIGLNDIPAA